MGWTTLDPPPSPASGSRMVVALAGELDLATVPFVLRLADRAAGPEVRRLVLDLARLDFCDAVGLRSLRDLQAALARKGVELVLAKVPARVVRVMAVTGHDLHLPVLPAD